MDPTAIASSLMSLSAQKTQMSANIAVMKKQFEMERSVLDILAPATAPAPAASGAGRLVDKTA